MGLNFVEGRVLKCDWENNDEGVRSNQSIQVS